MINRFQSNIRVRCTKNQSLYNSVQRLSVRVALENEKVKTSIALCAFNDGCKSCRVCINHVHQMLDAGFPIGTGKVLEPDAKPQDLSSSRSANS